MMVKLLQGRSAFELEVEFKSEYEFQLAANVLHEKINNNNNNNNRFTEMMILVLTFVMSEAEAGQSSRAEFRFGFA